MKSSEVWFITSHQSSAKIQDKELFTSSKITVYYLTGKKICDIMNQTSLLFIIYFIVGLFSFIRGNYLLIACHVHIVHVFFYWNCWESPPNALYIFTLAEIYNNSGRNSPFRASARQIRPGMSQERNWFISMLLAPYEAISIYFCAFYLCSLVSLLVFIVNWSYCFQSVAAWQFS